MATKSLLENKNSLSALISPVSPPTSASSVSDFTGFHLPPVTPRISPYSISSSVAGSSMGGGGTPHYSNLNNNYHRKGRPLPGGLAGLGGNGKKSSSSSSSGKKSKVSTCLCRCCAGLVFVLFWVVVGICSAVVGIIMIRQNWNLDVVEMGSQLLLKHSLYPYNSSSDHRNVIIRDFDKDKDNTQPIISGNDQSSTTPVTILPYEQFDLRSNINNRNRNRSNFSSITNYTSTLHRSSSSGITKGNNKSHPFTINPNKHEWTAGGECTTPACMQAAARFLHRLDPGQAPCEDFYKFSCGNFIARNEIPDDSFQRSTLQEMQEGILIDIKKLIDRTVSTNESIAIQKARQLYTSCMHNSFRTSHFTDYKHLPIYQVLSAQGIGEWPILQGSSWNRSEFNLERLLGQLFTHQVQSIFDLYVTQDEVEPTKYLLQFFRGEPAMSKSFFLNTTNPDYMKYLRSYKRLQLESVLILSQGIPTVLSDVEAILEFETNFAKLVQQSRCHFDGFDLDNSEDESNGRITVAELQSKVPQINWIQLIRNIFDNINIEANVTEDMFVYFHCSQFFPKLIALVEQTDNRTIANYLVWRFVFRYMPFLGNKFLQIWSEFMKDVPDTNEEKLYLSRWKYCANIVNDGFGMAVAYLYIQEYYGNRTEFKVKQMIHYLKKAFELVIHEQPWLPESFKHDLVEKLTNMGNKIGYPRYIMEPDALEHEYDGLEFNETYFLMNILKLRRYEVFKEVRKVVRPVDRDRDWLVQPLVANAFHNPTANEIVIPLGILRYPMFVEEYPMYLNFANLGVVISHEITHGFDHQGRHYDKDGNFTTTWWPDEVVSAFKTQAICFADQYGKFEMPIVSQNVDGNETLADNVCDNAALRISWLGYQLWMEDWGAEQKLPGVNLTISQVFYTLYAQIWCEVLNKEGYEQYVGDSHSPGQFRTWGVAQNNKYFGDVFHCPVGSPMNPKDKCILWS